jgi:flagellar biosynthesis chaperone FliJ
MMMGRGDAAVPRRKIKFIAAGFIGLALCATTIAPSSMHADDSALPSVLESPDRGTTPNGSGAADGQGNWKQSVEELKKQVGGITTQISGLTLLLQNQTSALQNQTAALEKKLDNQTSTLQNQTAALEKKLDNQTSALQNQTAALERKLDSETKELRTEIGTVRKELRDHMAEHPPPPVRLPVETKPQVVKRIIHIHRYYYLCCEPCWW